MRFMMTPSPFARDGRRRPACYGYSPFYALRAKGEPDLSPDVPPNPYMVP